MRLTRQHPRWGTIFTLAALPLAISCQTDAGITGGEPRVCTTEARPAVVATVQDATSGAYIASGATLILRDGAFVDSLVVPAGRSDLDAIQLSTPGTYERPGTYTVTLRKAPYITAVVVGVAVTADACHVQTKALNFQLATTFPAPTP